MIIYLDADANPLKQRELAEKKVQTIADDVLNELGLSSSSSSSSTTSFLGNNKSKK